MNKQLLSNFWVLSLSIVGALATAGCGNSTGEVGSSKDEGIVIPKLSLSNLNSAVTVTSVQATYGTSGGVGTCLASLGGGKQSAGAPGALTGLFIVSGDQDCTLTVSGITASSPAGTFTGTMDVASAASGVYASPATFTCPAVSCGGTTYYLYAAAKMVWSGNSGTVSIKYSDDLASVTSQGATGGAFAVGTVAHGTTRILAPDYTGGYTAGANSYMVDASGYLQPSPTVTGQFTFTAGSRTAEVWAIFPSTTVPSELKGATTGCTTGFGLDAATISNLSGINLASSLICFGNYLTNTNATPFGGSGSSYTLNNVFTAGVTTASSSATAALSSPAVPILFASNVGLLAAVTSNGTQPCGTYITGTGLYTSQVNASYYTNYAPGNNSQCMSANVGGYSGASGVNAANKWYVPSAIKPAGLLYYVVFAHIDQETQIPSFQVIALTIPYPS
ncbi:MAG: hypothetical protein V4591_02055 [Bdellovibrionota bacterium]